MINIDKNNNYSQVIRTLFPGQSNLYNKLIFNTLEKGREYGRVHVVCKKF